MNTYRPNLFPPTPYRVPVVAAPQPRPPVPSPDDRRVVWRTVVHEVPGLAGDWFARMVSDLQAGRAELGAR